MKKIFLWIFNLEYGSTFTKLFMHVSSRNMFPTIRNLQIRVHVYRPSPLLWRLINFRLFCSDDCRSWPRVEKINNHECWVSTHTFLTMIIEESVCFMSCKPFFFGAIIFMWYTRNIFLFFLINWTLCIGDNLPERVQILGHAHIICITVPYGTTEIFAVKYFAICS